MKKKLSKKKLGRIKGGEGSVDATPINPSDPATPIDPSVPAQRKRPPGGRLL